MVSRVAARRRDRKQPRPPHELPACLSGVGGLRESCFWLDCRAILTIPPYPQGREAMPGDRFFQRCAWPPACRDDGRLDPLSYWAGSGLSWKPSAAAFRSSALNMLALVLASYSSIDWVTYSWPYLSIL